jgi:thiamine-monophosphate kinase
VITGIGDDCAVLQIPKNHETLVTTDFSLEGTHFRLEWHPPESVGHRCLARGLSDIAAMGGEPLAAFLSIALPAKLPQVWADSFIKGLLRLAKQFGITLAGGDTAQSPNGVLADIVVVGSVPKGTALLRSEARPGDRIYVTGALGASGATLDLLYSGKRKHLEPRLFAPHFFPQPRVLVGIALRKKRIASAMIDISDGLSTDLRHICEESRVGAEVYESSIPRASLGKPTREVDLQFALHGGDDYELLFTARSDVRVPPKIAGIQITEIGCVTGGKGMTLVSPDGKRRKLQPRGWEHFRS